MSLFISGGLDLRVQRSLLQAYSDLNSSTLRLATMRRINSGADDPAGLMAAELLKGELTALQAASSNASQASHVIQVADSGLSEVSDLLSTIEGNLVEMAGGTLTPDQAAANQLEIDAALGAINRIGSTTNYMGRSLLDGGTLKFAITSDVGYVDEVTMPTVNTAELGGDAGTLSELASGGAAALGGDLSRGMEIVEQAASQISTARAELGSFARTALEASSDALGAAYVSMSQAYSQIMDTDVAAETSRMIRSEIQLRTAFTLLSITSHSHSLIHGLLAATR